MKPLSEASNELFHAAKNVVECIDQIDQPPTDSIKWQKAIVRLNGAVKNYNEVQCTNLAELIRKG